MIITITGKPCSGKGTVSKIFCKKFNFEYLCTGDMFRELAKQNGYDNILDFQNNQDVSKFDFIIDDKIKKIGKTRKADNLVIDSRLAWHFTEQSFKVFIDVSWKEAAKRLHKDQRETEKTTDEKHAESVLKNRWQTENDRYTKLYNTNNLDPANYDFVISSDNKTPEEIADKIFEEYKKFVEKI